MKNFKNILYYSVISGLFLVPFIAFIVPTTMFFPFITGKGFTFRIIAEILFGLYVLLAFYEPEYRPRDSWISRSVAIFTIITFVADIFGQNPYKSLWSNYERMEGFVLIFHLFLYYIVASSVLKSNIDWKRYLNVSIFASTLLSIYGIFQLLGKAVINQGGSRVDGTLGNATYFAIYLVFHIFLCLYYLVDNSTKKIQKYTYLAVIIIELVVLYYTATRGAILGLIGGVIISALYIVWKERENKLYKKISYGVLISVTAVIFGFALIKNTNFVKNSPVLSRFSYIGLSEVKSQGRYFVWPMAIKGFYERPILGWGQEGFNYVFNKYYNPAMYGQEEWFDRSHNVFLDWLIAGGLLGFLAYISLYVSLLYYVLKSSSQINQSDRAIILGMICAYVFHSIFVFDNLISYILFFSILAFVHSVYSHKLHTFDEVNKKTLSKDALNYVVFPTTIVLTISLVYFINMPALFANETLIKAITPQGDINKNLEYFKQAYSYNSFGYDEITEQLIQSAAAIQSQQNIPADVKQEFQTLAQEKIKEKISQAPHDARYLVFAGSYYNQLGKYDEAIDYLTRALKESPKKISIIFELGSSYMGKGDTKTMMELFRKGYELKPSEEESIKVLALGAIYTKDVKVLDELSPLVSTKSVINDDRFLKAYSAIGDYNKVIFILTTRLQADPKNVQNKLNLASAYAMMGQKQKAVDTLREVAVDHPEYKDQIESYIKQLLSQ